MTIENTSKINLLLQKLPIHAVITDKWLKKMEISNSLKHSYIKGKWLTDIGSGAVIRTGDKVNWVGGIFALQKQLLLNCHIGAKSALELFGFSHFIRFEQNKIIIFSSKHLTIPKWFLEYQWNTQIDITKSDFLPIDIGIEEREIDGMTINTSGPERAILELIYLVPVKQSFEETDLIMENLVSLRPKVVQSLLEACSSIKVKRIFLFLAEKHNHAWFNKLKLENINLGTGKRSIVTGGLLDKKYQITIPSTLKNE